MSLLAVLAMTASLTQAREFSTTGEWRYSAIEGPNPGSTTLYSNSSSATATWRPKVGAAGEYRLSSYAVARPGDAPVLLEIHHHGRTEEATLNPPGQAGWQVIGTYDLDPGFDDWVRFRRGGDRGNVRAAAFRIEKMEGGRMATISTVDQLVPYDGNALSGSAPTFAGGAPKGGSWKLTFSDDFDGTSIDTSKWKVSDNDTWGKILSGRFKDNVSVSGGMLHLVTKMESRGGKDWTTGMILSKPFQQKGGYFEARYRYAPNPGLNQAFWLKAVREQGAPLFEIDINEGHYPNFVNMTLHDKTSPSQTWAAGSDLSKDFHVFGLEWTSSDLIYYVDGKEVDRKPVDPSAPPCSIFLSTAVANWAGPVTKALDGSDMVVDWVRAYARQ